MDRGRLTIKLGSLISFQCTDGFLGATGIEGERLHLLSPPVAETGDEALPFFSFSKNVFRIVRTRGQSLAEEAAASGKSRGGSASNISSNNNNNSNNSGGSGGRGGGVSFVAALPKVDGILGSVVEEVDAGVKALCAVSTQDVTYGQIFSLMHADSGLYVSVAHSQPSRNDPDCVSIVLVNEDAARSASCEFICVSRYKIHSDGDALCKADEVLVRLAAKPVFLHVSAPLFMEAVEEGKEEELEVLSRNFRLGANLSFQRQSTGGGRAGQHFTPSPGISPQGSPNQSFALSRQTLHSLRLDKSDGTVAESRDDAIEGLTRAYLDEVNGCEEGGVSLILGRYDLGIDRANAERGQLHIARPYVACGIPLSFFHREREAFLTTSVTNPRPLRSNTVEDTEGGGVSRHVLKHRRFRGEMSGVTTQTGAEGRLHTSAVYAAAATSAQAAAVGEEESEAGTGAAVEVLEGADAQSEVESMSMQSRAQRAAMAAVRATVTVGLMSVGATRRLPFPVFADVPSGSSSAAGSETPLADTRSGLTSLWMVEAEDPTQGGPVRLQNCSYRLKHVITGLYLAVCGTAVDECFDDDVDDAASDLVDGVKGAVDVSHPLNHQSNNNLDEMNSAGVLSPTGRSLFTAARAKPIRETQLCLIPEPRTQKEIQSSLFSFESMFASECHYLIVEECLVVKNVFTSMYLCTDNTINGSDIRLELQWQPSVADTIVISYAKQETQRDALFVYNQSQTLAKFRDAFQAAALDKEQYRKARVAAAEAGDSEAKAEVTRLEKERACWETITQSSMSVADPDVALMKQHHMSRTTVPQPHSSGRRSNSSSFVSGVGGGASVSTSMEMLGHGHARVPAVARDYAALYNLIRQCQDTLVALIRFCHQSDDLDVLRTEGLPVPAHQRMLYDTRLFRLVFDVILTPFCQLAADPTYMSPQAVMDGGVHQDNEYGRGCFLPPAVSRGVRDAHVFQAVLSASQQRQVLMHSLWDLHGNNTNSGSNDNNNASCRSIHVERMQNRLPAAPLTGGVLDVAEILLPMHAEVHLVCRLAFRLLRLMAAEQSAFAEGWDDYIAYCLQLDGRRLHVIETMKAMFTDNSNLSLESVKTVADHFISAAQSNRRATYLDFLSAACTFKFKGFPERQVFITQKLLVEHPELLVEFVMHEGSLAVVPQVGQAPMPILEFFHNYHDRKRVKFVENQIALFARLCYDGCTQFCRDEVGKKVRYEMVLLVLKHYIWTGEERVGVHRKMDTLRANWIRLAFQGFIVDKICDPARQLRVSTVLFGSSGLRAKRDPRYHSGHADDDMTTALKESTLSLLKANPYFVQDDVDRSVLMRAVVAVWFRLIRFRQYTNDEIEVVLPLLMGLLDGTQDVVSTNPVVIAQQTQARRDAMEATGRTRLRRRRVSTDASGGGGGGKMATQRLEHRKESVHLMRIREMICQSLAATLDNAMSKAADEVIVYLHDVYTNPAKHRDAGEALKPWKEGGGTNRRGWLGGYGSAELHAVGVRVLKGVPTEVTALIPTQHEAGCCGGCGGSGGSGSNSNSSNASTKKKKKGKPEKKKERADGYEAVGSGGDDDENKDKNSGDNEFEEFEDAEDNEDDPAARSVASLDSALNNSNINSESDDDDDEVFRSAGQWVNGAGGNTTTTHGTETVLVTATDIRDYLDFLNARICRRFTPGRLVPLLLDITRYNSDALTVQSMRLLVQLCVVRRTMAQMILAVNTLPSMEVVRSFDTIHDVAVKLRQTLSATRTFGEEWSNSIKVALGTLLESFDDKDTGLAGSPRHWRANAEEVQVAADAAARAKAAEAEAEAKAEAEAEASAAATSSRSSSACAKDRESDLRNIYSSFALAAKERRMFGSVGDLASEGFTGERAPTASLLPSSSSSQLDTGAPARSRAQQLWAKTAGATRMLVYSNTIKSRRQALGLSATSNVPMNLVVRAEMMAHWRIHETLLAMLPLVPPSEKSFFRLMKFFYFFTLSQSNAKLLRQHIKLFIDTVPKGENVRALSLNIIVAILGTMHNVNDYLTVELLATFVQRIDGEVNTKIPDREFVGLLSDKIFSRPVVSVVVRRRIMLILRENNTFSTLSRPRVNPTVVEVDFTSALMNLVCNICGSAISVLTLAQRMLPSANICRIILQRFLDNPLGIAVNVPIPQRCTFTDSSLAPTPPAQPAAATAITTATKTATVTPPLSTATGCDTGSFKLINPYLRALVALYFTTLEDNVEDRRLRQNDWMSNPAWWDILRLVSASFSTCARLIGEGKDDVDNEGLGILEANRMYFLTTAPIAVAAFFVNCYHRASYTKYLPTVIRSAMEDFIIAAADLGRAVMGSVRALDLRVEEVVNFRRLLGVLNYLGTRSGYAVMQCACGVSETVKNAMREWLAQQQSKLHARLLVEQEQRRQLGISHVNDDDASAFDILFREEAVSNQLQSGMHTGKGLLLSSAATTDRGVMQVRAALRATLRGNTLIPSLRRQPGEVVLIVNALLIQSTHYASLRESLRHIVAAMQEQLFTPRTFVGLLDLFYNSLDSVLYRYSQTTTLEKVLRNLPPHVLVDSNEAPRKAPEWELAQMRTANANASIAEDSLAYGLQVVYNATGMSTVSVALCAIDDDVVTYNAVRLGVALLEGGNARVQSSLLQYFTTREEGFFHNVRDVLRGAMAWAERVNAEHQYYLLKRGLQGAGPRTSSSSSNMQLVEGMKPKASGADGSDTAFMKLSGWGRVMGSRRLRLVTRTFRLLQLFCEGHQTGMQNYIRAQHDNLHSANMVHEAAVLLAELSVYITPANLKVVSQGFDLLAEVCQGPCRANQESLITYEVCATIAHCLVYVNGPDIIMGDTAVDRLNNLSDEDVGGLRTSMSTTAVALIEGCREREIYEKMLTQLPLQDIEVEISSVSPAQLYRIANDERYEHHPRAEALYNWLIYLKSVQPHATDLQLRQINEILRRSSSLAQYLGSIEINRDDGLERVYFRIPPICASLTQESKSTLLWEVDRTSRATKLADFLHKSDEVIFAVEQQHDFVTRVRRWTRFKVSYDSEGSRSSQCCARLKTAYNDYLAPLLFSYEIGYYEAMSMVLAVTVNVILVIFEGVDLRGGLGNFIQTQEVRLVSALCFMQTLACLAMCYVGVIVALPVHLYEMYKEKQRFASGKAKFNIGMDEVYAGLTRQECFDSFFNWFGAQFRFFLLVMAALSWLVSPYFAAFNLMLLIYKIPTLRTFITAITANGKQLLLTALLGLIMLYLFSIVGYLLFSSQYDPDAEEPDDTNCKTLSRCFLYILEQGLRAGGGVGDVMKPWTWTATDAAARLTYDMLFYALVTVVFLNILFGIIIDTFGQMRDEKNEKEEDMHGLCFICGLDNDTLEKTGVSGFVSHVKTEHNMWMYLYFMHHLRRKDPSEYTGQESYVNSKIQQNSLAFFPNENCLSLMALHGAGGRGDSSSDSDSDSDDGDGDGSGGGDGGGAGAGRAKGKDATAVNLVKELAATRDSMNTFLKEISSDSARLKGILQQLEISARSGCGSGGGAEGSSGGPTGLQGSRSKTFTLAPGQTRGESDVGSGLYGRGSGNAGSDVGSGNNSGYKKSAASLVTTAGAAGGGNASNAHDDLVAQAHNLEQQLRQAREDRTKMKEESSRHRATAQRREAELEHLRAELARTQDRRKAGGHLSNTATGGASGSSTSPDVMPLREEPQAARARAEREQDEEESEME